MMEALRELVGIDSTSTRSNLPLLAALERRVRALGFETRMQRWKDAAGVEKGNLIAQRGAGRPGLALVGHSDCVPFDPGWQGALTGEVRDAKLFGRGAADTKAFIAAALGAAGRVRIHAQPLALVFTADEEVGCLGARALVEEGTFRPVRAIVGEPTRMTPVLGHKGYCLAEIAITGAEGHSAYPETGESAILAAGRLLRALEQIADELRSDSDPAFFPPWTSLNVGLISGGKAKNIIPGSCSLTVEWRPLPRQDPRLVLGKLEQAAAQISTGRIRAEVRVQRLDGGIAVPKDTPLVSFLSAESGHAPETIPFGTELPYLIALGAEACVFGPGDIRVAHRTGEFVPLDELARAEEILAGAISRFCG